MTDVLTDVSDALRIRTTLFAMAHLTSPWGVRFPAGDGAYFHTAAGAGCWLRVDRDDPLHLGAGDVALLAGGTAHQPGSTD